MKLKIELVRPLVGSDGARRPHKGEQFGAGERIILVEGERWGRTRVAWHGVHGTSTTFYQENGDQIGGTDGRGRFTEMKVWSAKERHAKTWINGQYRLPDDFKNTETLVAEAVAMLVETRCLVDPQSALADREKEQARAIARHQAAQRREDEAFRKRAMDAIGLEYGPTSDAKAALLDRVIEAMRWAQQQ